MSIDMVHRRRFASRTLQLAAPHMSDHFDKIKMIAPRWFMRDKRAT
jgi:hypothetical protein